MSRSRFETEDPQLRRLKSLHYRHVSKLVRRLATLQPGIYTLTGGRQVGKTTLVKQTIQHLLGHGNIPGERIYYLTGEVIGNREALISELNGFLDGIANDTNLHSYIFIDEVTYIDSWHVAVKFLADAGRLDSCVVVLTGSDTVMLKDVVTRLAGRRGGGHTVDFTCMPLSFREYLQLRESVPRALIEEIADGGVTESVRTAIPVLYRELDTYFVTGGYLTALNDAAIHAGPRPGTYKTYIDWITGDFLKRGKNERSLREVLGGIVKTYGSQVTWNSLAADLTIHHHQTVYEYCEMLSTMGALYIQHALREDKLRASPKKAKKLHFTDPFIGDAVCRATDLPVIDTAARVESIVISHLQRRYPVYYIKSEGEIDCAYVTGNEFRPVEIKWTGNIRPEHFKYLRRYRNSMLAARVDREMEIEGIPVVPLPVALLR